MATTETVQPPAQHERNARRRPFSTWMKKLANFKNTSTSDSNHTSSKRHTIATKSLSKKHGQSKHNSPYMAFALLNGHSNANALGSLSTIPTRRTASISSAYQNGQSYRSSLDGAAPHTAGSRSIAPTLSTEADNARSVAAQSHAASSGEGTTTTIGPSTRRGADSTFSSPAPSLRSLTTTLTTVHSTANGLGTGTTTPGHHAHHGAGAQNTQTITFSHQFPTSPPPNALPPHLALHATSTSGGHPATYTTATANNLLTDNASILTLASSSKRRRRRSMDTDASVRALAPSSLFGGSRESLPLSVLSSSIEPGSSTTAGIQQARQSLGGPNERASIYSATGVTPALPSERNSFYAGRQSIVGDGGSINSGRLGHGRNDSISGSIGGIAATSSPLASPREGHAIASGKLSRTNSAWGEEIVDPEKIEENGKGLDL